MNEEEYITLIIDSLDKIHEAEATTDKLKLQMSETILEFKNKYPERATSLSKSTPIDGVYYSIKTRNGLAYLCACKRPFGSWKKKKSEE